MNYRTILVHLDTSERAALRLDSALRVARKFNAHLDGLFAVFSPESQGFHVMAGSATWFEQHRHECEQHRASVERLYAAELARADVKGNWMRAEGDPNVDVPRRARAADLVIASQTDHDDPNAFVAEDFIENLVLSAGRPVLLLPRSGQFETIGRRVLVAWDGSREASRALYDALPFIARAEQTTVLTVGEPGKPADAFVSGTEIALTLARHNAMVNVDHASGASVGDVLLTRANDGGHDLIVMGAYGHGRWRELVMGGASRTVLESMTVPVLMSH